MKMRLVFVAVLFALNSYLDGQNVGQRSVRHGAAYIAADEAHAASLNATHAVAQAQKDGHARSYIAAANAHGLAQEAHGRAQNALRNAAKASAIDAPLRTVWS